MNQLKIGVILSYVITGLNMLVNLIYTPVMIRILGQSEYGLYTLVGSAVSYLSLFSLGFSGAYLRFYSRYASRDDKMGVAIPVSFKSKVKRKIKQICQKISGGNISSGRIMD